MGERRRAKEPAEVTEATEMQEAPVPPPPLEPPWEQVVIRLEALEATVAGMERPTIIAEDGSFPAMLQAMKSDPAQRRGWQGLISWAQRTQGGTRGPLTDWLLAL